jgi:hypothetical protein
MRAISLATRMAASCKIRILLFSFAGNRGKMCGLLNPPSWAGCR